MAAEIIGVEEEGMDVVEELKDTADVKKGRGAKEDNEDKDANEAKGDKEGID